MEILAWAPKLNPHWWVPQLRFHHWYFLLYVASLNPSTEVLSYVLPSLGGSDCAEINEQNLVRIAQV